MKKILICLLFLGGLVFWAQEVRTAEAQESRRQKSTVLLVINNIAKTKYDEKLNTIMDEALHKKIDGIYNEVEPEQYKLKFAGKSWEAAGLKEILNLVSDATALDYLVYVELRPFEKESNYNLVYYDKKMTANLLLRIVSVSQEKELYKNSFSIEAKDSLARRGGPGKDHSFRGSDQYCVGGVQ